MRKRMKKSLAKLEQQIQKLEDTKATERTTAQARVTTLEQKLAQTQAKLRDSVEQKASLQAQLEQLTTTSIAEETVPSQDLLKPVKTASVGGKIKLQPAAQKKVQKVVALLTDGTRAGRVVNHKAVQTAYLQMTVQQTEEQNALESFKADVSIKSLDGSRTSTRVRNHYGTISRDRNNINVPVALEALSPGVYRLNLSVRSVQPPFNLSSPKFEGNTIVQLV